MAEPQPSLYTCPDCGGVLQQTDDEGLDYSCHIGHDWAAGALVGAKSKALEQALIEAVRTLREKSMLLRQLAVISSQTSEATARLIEQADQDDEHARLIRSHLLDREEHSIDVSDDILADLAQDMRRRSDD
jgi:two-component system, chemotaxis family, protein-glutamate methylesterase/glutaminase